MTMEALSQELPEDLLQSLGAYSIIYMSVGVLCCVATQPQNQVPKYHTCFSDVSTIFCIQKKLVTKMNFRTNIGFYTT